MPSKHYQTALPLVQQGKENLLITRTFSKIYGMAGMRIGYEFAAPETAKKLKGFSADWNLNIGGIVASQTSPEDHDFRRQSLISHQKAKQIFINTLNELSLNYIPSHTNFVLHKINSDLMTCTIRMQSNNINNVGRRMVQKDGRNRLTIGTPEQMVEFSKTLKLFRSKGWV